jgi:hypothetical protein
MPGSLSDESLNRRLHAIYDRATDAERRLLAGVSVAELAGEKRKTRGRKHS